MRSFSDSLDIGHAAFDGVRESLQPSFGLGSFLAEFCDVRRPVSDTLLAAIKDNPQNLFQTARIKQALVQVLGQPDRSAGPWDWTHLRRYRPPVRV
jgi:hypothetical protein